LKIWHILIVFQPIRQKQTLVKKKTIGNDFRFGISYLFTGIYLKNGQVKQFLITIFLSAK